METKLNELYAFLIENRKYNFELQNNYYKRILRNYEDSTDRLIALLYETANTQSRPKIDKLKNFHKNIFENKNSVNNFENFVKFLNAGQNVNFESLFLGLKKQEGWGDKTSALFVKVIYHIHNGQYDEELRIWDSVPNFNEDNDNLYLPVDAVIINIFNKMKKQNWNFRTINKKLSEIENRKKLDIEVWDDLWFWGFINQKGSSDRSFEWNEGKYWMLFDSNKSQDKIREIKKKSAQFNSILNK
ncbi:hypothetical protein [Chryseobacterium sp. 5_R23647]|uniref:hypothetical protein n=1 Tax=Chryseobacterium TaxID=59732 RepID=UPI000E224EF4|nr:hypothetical protein [Chryseobacterium sp. 5_R23647]REC45136.1 hypothetical protein DRF69_04515 [Chryseobacterium sp. 5_R23647]